MNPPDSMKLLSEAGLNVACGLPPDNALGCAARELREVRRIVVGLVDADDPKIWHDFDIALRSYVERVKERSK